MRIFGGSKGFGGAYSAQKEPVKDLQKSEIIADLFNNQAENEENATPVKVRLSYMSKILLAELHSDMGKLFEEHPDLGESINGIELPDEDWVANKGRADLTLRKVGSYLRWLELRGEGEPEESEAAYAAVNSLGKDEQIQAVYEKNQSKQQELLAVKGRSAPNYYYMLYPETYSFN